MRDPYETLGVARDATPEQVDAAYRGALKRSHPDAGGSSADLQAVTGAGLVLRDPVRRARYDATGDPGSDEPDNATPLAVSIFSQFFDGVIDAWIKHGYDEQWNPARRDLLAEFTAKNDEEIRGLEKAEREGEVVLAKVRDLKSRLGGGSRLAALALDDRARRTAMVLSNIAEKLGACRAARDVVQSSTFDPDTSQFWPASFAGTFRTWSDTR